MSAPRTIRFHGRAGGTLHQAQITRRPGGEVHAVVDGREYTLSVTQPQAGTWSILNDGVSIEARVLVRGGSARVHVGRRCYDVQPEQPGSASAGRRPGEVGGRVTVTAVMPGRVVRVNVAEGDTVAAQQGLVVLEAMKMENELSAPREGIVKQVRVKPGQTVETGDPLVILE